MSAAVCALGTAVAAALGSARAPRSPLAALNPDSPRAESAYIASRPFRVNAGAVHGYAAAPGGRTAYLSELRSGGEALVADAAGRVRAAVVGRVKLEARPLVLVEARVPGEAEAASVLLQNAETVRLVGPAAGGAGGGWRAISVAELAVGDAVYVLRGGGARHTGVAIEERVEER